MRPETLCHPASSGIVIEGVEAGRGAPNGFDAEAPP